MHENHSPEQTTEPKIKLQRDMYEMIFKKIFFFLIFSGVQRVICLLDGTLVSRLRVRGFSDQDLP